MLLVLTVLVVLGLLLASEWWWRGHRPHGEVSRKFIHITVGSFAAFWPYFLDTWAIILMSVAFIVVVLISKRFNIFKTIHAVERPTWGEFFFAAAVGLLAVFAPHPAIYTAALLHMALADGLAAIAGTKFGTNNSYMILGHKKSVAGTLTFLVCSWFILIGFATIQTHLIAPAVLVAVALGATLLENVSVRGFDNLAVPLLIAVSLSILA